MVKAEAEATGSIARKETRQSGKPASIWRVKSFREVHQEQQRKRANRTKPPPWITRKLAVFIVFGLLIYSTYVYVGRACAPLIRRDVGALGSGKGMGGESELEVFEDDVLIGSWVGFFSVAFLSIFWVLWIMIMWSYIKVRLQVFPSFFFSARSKHDVLVVIQIILTPPGYARDVSPTQGSIVRHGSLR